MANETGATPAKASFADLFKGLINKVISKSDFDLKGFLKSVVTKAGEQDSCAYSPDPVNLATGNFVYAKDDIVIPGSFPLVFNRFYNALGGTNDILGDGWTHNFNICLSNKEGIVSITFDDGHTEFYKESENESYAAELEAGNSLNKLKNGFSLTLPSMEQYIFDANGLLESITDLNGNTIKLLYNGGLLSKVSNSCGCLYFSYDKNKRLICVSDNTRRQVKFEYADNLLTKVTHPLGEAYQYEYNGQRKLARLINPLGITSIHNDYDEMGRTVSQSFADGGISTMDYCDLKYATTLTEQSGNKIQYFRDSKYRTIKTVYADSEERFEYNDSNKRTLHVDRNGNERRFEYDIIGNLLKKTDPLGNTTLIEYNDYNKPIKITNPNGGTVTHTYDGHGNMSSSIDPIGRTLSITHDEHGLVTEFTLPDGSKYAFCYDERCNITSFTDANGNQTMYEYDELNRVVKTINPEGHTTQFTYDLRGDIIKVVNADGKECIYEYNTQGKICKIIDFNGGEIRCSYNKLNRIEEIVDQMGGSTKFSHDLMWNINNVTDPNGNTTKYEYNKLNRLVAVTDPEGNTTKYEHDANGNVTAVISATGTRTEMKYDALDRLVEVKEPDHALSKFEYDYLGNPVKVIDPLNNATEHIYDLAGLMIKRKDILGNTTYYTYNPLGQVETIRDAKDGIQKYEYYPGGKIRSICLPEGEKESYEYDKNGNLTRVIDGLGQVTELFYDVLDRVVEIKNPLGYSKLLFYDAMGNIHEVVNENGHKTQFRYSLLGDMIEVIDALGNSTKYGYDKTRNLSRVEQYSQIDSTLAHIKQVESRIINYERNKNGQVTAVNSPLGQVVRYKYDGLGNVASKLDEDGLETLYEYNSVNRLSKIAYADGRTIELSYNLLKHLIEMKDWLGITTISTDAMGRVEQIEDFEGKKVQYEWDELHRKEKIIYPDLSEVEYKYNHSGRLKSVLSVAGKTRYQYDALGRISQRELPNRVTTSYKYNQLGQISSLTHLNRTEVLDQFSYIYDPTGNITQINKNRKGFPIDSGVFDYAYDSLGRLVQASRGWAKKEYTYDSLGNRTSSIEKSCTVFHEYNELNQLICTHNGDVTEEFSYDKRGNLTEVFANGELKAHYDFDATNMMVEAFSAEKGVAKYTYNGFRDRVKRIEQFNNTSLYNANGFHKSESCLETRYIPDMTRPYNNLLMTEGSQPQRYIWGNELLEAEGEEEFYYLQDHLGSPIRLLDGGNDREHDIPMAYDDFGIPLVNAGRTSSNPFGFTGYQFEDVSGLYYAQARYYSPLISRFSSQDPIMSGVNWYNYCLNDPVNRIDPWGLISYILYDPHTHLVDTKWYKFYKRFNSEQFINPISAELKRIYGTKVEIKKTENWTETEFAEWWNSLGEDIDAIVFFGHGDSRKIEFDSRYRPNNAHTLTVDEINNINLEVRKMDMLLFLSCDSGRLGDTNNIATAFTNYIGDHGRVVGAAGLNYDYPMFGMNIYNNTKFGRSRHFVAFYKQNGITYNKKIVEASNIRSYREYIRRIYENSRFYMNFSFADCDVG
ncbi:MAG: DUF6531 domain-containing protein [Oscillospiraceae bacterium]|nr:DUF6531 domain-containing protein [Oscillospiraceae bacterium]